MLGCTLNDTGWLEQTATLLEITPGLADDISQDTFCDILSAVGPQLRLHNLVKCFLPWRNPVAPHLPTLYPIEMLVVLTTLVKKIELANYCLVDHLVGLE